MRLCLKLAVVSLVLLPMSAFAQKTVLQKKSAVPRASDGKPDLTGVWQGGSTRRGSWEEANTGLGVGGTGTAGRL